MEKNNGKIAIAIVAMFVVALSIIGLTYAYFTAAIKENDSNAEEVKVLAGSMIVNYTGGRVFTVSNILPGWFNDNDKYYDVKESNVIIDATTGETGYKAASKAAVESEQPFGGSDATSGLAAPVTFSVENDGDNPAAYDVKMKVLTNDVSTTGDLKYHVFAAGTAEALEVSNDITNEELLELKIKTGNLTAKDDVLDIESGIKLATKGNARYYKIIFEYVNNTSKNEETGEYVQNAQQGRSFSTEMIIKGLDQNAAK